VNEEQVVAALDELDDRDLLILIPAPRRSPENIGVR
jgi:hypothetical protein